MKPIVHQPDTLTANATRHNCKSFTRFMQKIIDRKILLAKRGTARNYKATLNSFAKFAAGRKVTLAGLSAVLIEEYEAWLKTTRICSNSISFYMRNLRAMYNLAVEEGLTADRTPFRKAYTRIEKTSKRAISVAEIKRIKELDLTTAPHLDLARDTFMFLFYCRGMSLIDAAHLTAADICGAELRYRRRKTGQSIRIGLNKYILGLLSKWESRFPDSPYLIPILRTPYPAVSARPNFNHTIYDTALRRINKSLKQIAAMASITTNLTTYVTRHSWASIAKSKGIPTATISDALGHDSELTTQIYLASLSPDTIDRANNAILADL